MISSHLVNTPDGVELQIQAQSVRKVEYYLFVPDPHHTNLIFDVSVPFDLMKDKAELKKKIDDCVQFQDHKYYAVVTFEAACIEKTGS